MQSTLPAEQEHPPLRQRRLSPPTIEQSRGNGYRPCLEAGNGRWRDHRMETRILGRTGLVVTPIGLGLAALGRPGYITLKHGEDLRHEYSVDAMQAQVDSVLDAAWQAGINYFDAARSYGRAEVFLASWLTRNEISPQAVTVGSKWGYTYTAD